MEGSAKYTFIYTLQKCGTHLLSNICALLLNKRCNICDKNEMYKVVPHFTGFNNYRYTQGYAQGGIISTHPMYMPYHNDGLQNARILSSVRNPLDVCISNYFYNACRVGKVGIENINVYVQKRIVAVCQDMRNHIAFMKAGGERRYLVRYEDLVSNNIDTRIKTVDGVIHFLKIGGHKLCNIDSKTVVEKVDIGKAKAEEKRRGMYQVGVGQIYPFHRDGSVGQWKKHLRSDVASFILKYIEINMPDLYQLFYSSSGSDDDVDVDVGVEYDAPDDGKVDSNVEDDDKGDVSNSGVVAEVGGVESVGNVGEDDVVNGE